MKAKLSSLSVSTLGALASGCITVSRKPAYTVVSDNVLLKAVEEEYAAYFLVFDRKVFSGMGSTVAEGDMYRDEPFRAMKSILKGFIKVSGSSLQADAKVLFGIIEQLGSNLDRLEYSEENQKMDKLIAEFDKPENAVRLANLNLTELFATLKTRNAAFLDLFFKQTGMNAELHAMATASSLRDRLSEALRNYLAVVTAMKSVAGWEVLYNELNEVVKKANATLSSQSDDTSSTATDTTK